jgi:hypothetical protein
MSLGQIQEAIGAALRPLGFIERKGAWNRRSAGFVDVIDLQMSKSGDMVTINVGVLHERVHVNVWGTDVPAFVDEPSSTVRVRLGQLIDGKDTWLALEETPTASQLTDLLVRHGLPFVDSLHSVEAMESYLTLQGVIKQRYPLPKIHLALLMHERGDKAAACLLLAEIRSTTTAAWQGRVDEVRKRIACD